MIAHNRIDLTGKRINFLTVIKAAKSEGKYSMWWCRCDCGKKLKVAGRHLHSKGRTTRSCRDCLYKRLTKHGMADTKEYRVWLELRNRCNDKKDAAYKNYGGRGISYSKDWESFDVFFKDMGFAPSKEYSIDRIDNNGNYCKENCRWATKIQQARNVRSNRLVEINGETKCLAEWCEIYGISYVSIWSMGRRGISTIDAINKLVEKKKGAKSL